MYNTVYLVKVEPGANNNKFYRMVPNKSNTAFDAEYGRIGNTNFQTRTYSISDWDKKYNEKIRKGYEDKTSLFIVSKEKQNNYIDIKDKSINSIVRQLQIMAKRAIEQNYTITSEAVTKAMVEEAEYLIYELVNKKDTEAFNKCLLEIFKTIPRKMFSVSAFLANTCSDFANIITREQDLLDIMKTQVKQQEVETEEIGDNMDKNILDALGLVFENIDDEDEKLIKKNLASCATKYKNAWRVTNLKTQKRFDDYCENFHITDKKLLWHGSRNENWWNIINTGLVLRPTNAVITGKMFGYGCYFAPKAAKSIGYTSLYGSRWTDGKSGIAYMALNNVAYGKPFDVYNFNPKYYNLDYESLQRMCKGANCLHAHNSKGMLREDEIVVYKEDQITIKYLVELTNR